MTEPWFDELAEFLRIPSISADAAQAGRVGAAAEWVRDFIRAAGGTCELVDWHGQPLDDRRDPRVRSNPTARRP